MSFSVLLTLFASIVPLQGEARVLAHLPADLQIEKDSLRFARGGKQVAYTGYRGEAQVTVIGDAVGEEFTAVEVVAFDSAGEHVAYRAQSIDKKGRETWTLIVDGKKVVTTAWIGQPAFSPADGTVVYWSADRWDKVLDKPTPALAVLVLGRKKSSRFDFVAEDLEPAFSSDGHVVFGHGLKGDEDAVLVLDAKGKESLMHVGEIAEVVARPDGAEVACTVVKNSVPVEADTTDEELDAATKIAAHAIARATIGAKGKAAKPTMLGTGYDSAGRAVYSADGKHIAYCASRLDRVGVAMDGEIDAACEYDVIGEIAFDASGTHVAYVTVADCTVDPKMPRGFRVLESGDRIKDGKWRVVHGATKSDTFERTALPRWSPDGGALAFAAKSAEGWCVHCGEHASGLFDEIAELEWAADGKAVWFGARKGRELSWNSLAVE
ncbi:MAG: hypothetical protein K8S98_14410 [Planctomycetes bacterium]|nr:hypothetical protein [Planctomycetota bacterium]